MKTHWKRVNKKKVITIRVDITKIEWKSNQYTENVEENELCRKQDQ